MATGRPRSVSDEAVFAAVTAVVSEVGPSGLTLSAVAERAGVTAPALAQRFGSKRNLLLAYVAAAATGVDELFAKARASSPDALAAARAALIAFARPITSRAGAAHNMAFLHLDLTDAEFGAHAAKQSRLVRRHLAELAQEALDAGQLHGVDADIFADTLYTVYSGAVVTWAVDGRGSLTRWVSERLDRVIAPHLPPP